MSRYNGNLLRREVAGVDGEVGGELAVHLEAAVGLRVGEGDDTSDVVAPEPQPVPAPGNPGCLALLASLLLPHR